MTERLKGLGPVADRGTRVLVLGSFPSVASLKSQQYYGHPQNHFWKILGQLWGEPLVDMAYAARIDALLRHGLGVWDVYGSCEREGSLDTNIRQAEPNDLGALVARCPGLQAIGHNGGESYRHAKATLRFGLPVHRLPSTSPANASWSFERKLAAWRDVLSLYGVCDA